MLFDDIAKSITDRIKIQLEVKKKLNILQPQNFYHIKTNTYEFIIEFEKIDDFYIYTTRSFNISNKHILNGMFFKISSITDLRYATEDEKTCIMSQHVDICNMKQGSVYKWTSIVSEKSYVFIFDSLCDGYIYTKEGYRVGDLSYDVYRSQIIKISDIKSIKPANVSEINCLLSLINPVKRLSKLKIVHNKYKLRFNV